MSEERICPNWGTSVLCPSPKHVWLVPRTSGEALQRLVDSGVPLTESQRIAIECMEREAREQR